MNCWHRPVACKYCCEGTCLVMVGNMSVSYQEKERIPMDIWVWEKQVSSQLTLDKCPVDGHVTYWMPACCHLTNAAPMQHFTGGDQGNMGGVGAGYCSNYPNL